MKTALQGKGRSAGYARDRMKMLLVSERIDCSPQMMRMLKNDMIHTVKNILQLTRRKLRSASLRNLLFFMRTFLSGQKRNKGQND